MRVLLFLIIPLVATVARGRPVVRDVLRPVPLTHTDLGGVIDGRIMSLVNNHYMVIDVDNRWLAKFRNRDETPL